MLITVFDHLLNFTAVVDSKMCDQTTTALHFFEHLFCSHAALSKIFDQRLNRKTTCTLRSEWTVLIIDDVCNFTAIL